MMIFNIRIFHLVNLICFSYGIQYSLASDEKGMPNSVQLPSPEFLDDYNLHRNLLAQKRNSQGAEKSLFNELKLFLSQIECFKSH